MKIKTSNLIILILGICNLLIMYNLLVNMSIFVDEHNLSIDIVLGSNIHMYLYWIMGILNLFVCIISAVSLKNKK